MNNLQRMVRRTDEQILNALQELPWRIDILYKRGLPKSDSMPTLREQINHFLDIEASAPNDQAARGSATGTATSENESVEAWIIEAARELAMDSAHILAIAGIIKRHAPKPNARTELRLPGSAAKI